MGITYTAALGFALLGAKASGFEDNLVLDLFNNMSRAISVNTETEAETACETYLGFTENFFD